MLSCVSLCDPIAPQATLSVRFPRQEDWSGLPFPFPGGLPDPGIEPTTLALAGRFLTTEPPGKVAALVSSLNWICTGGRLFAALGGEEQLDGCSELLLAHFQP